MTDRELAEEYYNSKFKSNESHFSKSDIEQTFLAGLNAGRLKWHKVADDILPDNYRYVWTNVGAGYYDGECWRDDFGRLQGVVAWCEPEFKESEK